MWAEEVFSQTVKYPGNQNVSKINSWLLNITDWEVIGFPNGKCFLLFPGEIFISRDTQFPACDWKKRMNFLDNWSASFKRDHSQRWLVRWEYITYYNVCRNIAYQASESRPSFWASHRSALIKDSTLAFLVAPVKPWNYSETVDRGASIMSVDVKHPLDAASTDLLEVSRHRLEPLSTKLEERDADVMKVGFIEFFCKDRLLFE